MAFKMSLYRLRNDLTNKLCWTKTTTTNPHIQTNRYCNTMCSVGYQSNILVGEGVGVGGRFACPWYGLVGWLGINIRNICLISWFVHTTFPLGRSKLALFQAQAAPMSVHSVFMQTQYGTNVPRPVKHEFYSRSDWRLYLGPRSNQKTISTPPTWLFHPTNRRRVLVLWFKWSAIPRFQ